MKSKFVILLSLLVTLTSRADFTNSLTATPNTLVPDGNPVGLSSTLTFSGVAGPINNITVTLNITGGFNGDLYAYLTSPTASLVVLLNRVGMGSGNPFGYGNTGFSNTLDSAAAYNIHNYQSTSYSLNVGGQLTGTWAPDSRTINPLSSAGAFDAAPTGSTLADLNGNSPNGTWTLFIADLSGGGQSTLVSWGLTVVTVPEPQTWTIFGGGLTGFWWLARKRRS
jgi:subtilisin-like proprotein convertase family protein